MTNIYDLFTKISPYSLVIENNQLVKLIIKHKNVLKRMNLDDLFILMNEINSPSQNGLLGGSPSQNRLLGGSPKRSFEETKELVKGLCSVTAKAIIYSFRGILTPSELCFMSRDIASSRNMNIRETLKEYSDALEFFRRCETKSGKKEAKCALRPTAVKPTDLSGFFVHTHGGLFPNNIEFEVPKNTYIVYLTELGKFGFQSSQLLDILSNTKAYQELLYLLTFDFNDEYLNYDYFKQKVVYGPHAICPDSIIDLSDYEEVNCLTYFDGLEVPTGKFSTNLKTSPDQITPFMAPYGMGIYELPITDINDTKPKEILVNYKDSATQAEIKDDRSLDTMKAINPNLEYSIKDIPYYIGYSYNIIQNDAGDLISSTPLYNKNDTTWEAKFNLNYPDWTNVVDKDKYYSCSAKMFDDPTVIPRTYKTVQDINKIINPTAADKTHMKFSDCVNYLREETNKKYNEDKRLVIVTGKCRSMAGLQTDVISGCLKLENTSITLMNLMEKTQEESDILLQCILDFSLEYDDAYMKQHFSKEHSGINTGSTNTRRVKAKRQRV